VHNMMIAQLLAHMRAIMVDDNLLPIEQEAKEFVLRIGEQRANRILNAICRRFDRRYNKACSANNVPINPEWIFKTDFEVSLTYKIQLGLQLTDDYNTPQAARQRILKRLEERKSRRAARIHQQLGIS